MGPPRKALRRSRFLQTLGKFSVYRRIVSSEEAANKQRNPCVSFEAAGLSGAGSKGRLAFPSPEDFGLLHQDGFATLAGCLPHRRRCILLSSKDILQAFFANIFKLFL